MPETSNGAAPDTLLGRKELAERIRAALDDLPFDQRTALVLREIDGLSYHEIAEALGVPKGTVMSRLHHARRRVREALAAAGALEADASGAGAEEEDR